MPPLFEGTLQPTVAELVVEAILSTFKGAVGGTAATNIEEGGDSAPQATPLKASTLY